MRPCQARIGLLPTMVALEIPKYLGTHQQMEVLKGMVPFGGTLNTLRLGEKGTRKQGTPHINPKPLAPHALGTTTSQPP